jgi:SAM-dependent methyltransferase
LVFLLGGFTGSGINIIVSSFCFFLLRLDPLLSFFLGTACNEAFHHFYYHVLCVNQEIRMRSPLPVQLSLYLAATLAATGLLWFFLYVLPSELPFRFLAGIVLAMLVLSVVNTAVNSISAFSSSKLADVEYREMGEDCYDEQTDSQKVGSIRAGYHRRRFYHLTAFVEKYYKPGFKVVDLGCGNCMWNTHELPVLGVDINEKMLNWALRNKHISEFCVRADLANTGLPDKSFDIVILTEVLEHLEDIAGTLAEIRRILKDDGTFLLTVPYDWFLGPFFITFNLNCLYQGFIKGSDYHKLRCGHINHFTQPRLRKVYEEADFRIISLRPVDQLWLFCAALKGEPGTAERGETAAEKK